MERKSNRQTNPMTQVKKILKGLAYSVAIALASVTASAKATEYEIIRLLPEDPNVNYSMLHSINNNGEILGIYGELGDEIGRDGYPILWKENFLYINGIFKKLDIELGNYTHDVINDFGEILAKNPDSPGSSSGIYKADGAIGLDFWGSDMNNKNEVCGFYGSNYPYWRDSEGNTIELLTGSGYGACALGINDKSQITGYTCCMPHHMACIWENNEIRYLEQLETHTQGLDINNKGEVAGHHGSYPSWWDAEGNIHVIYSAGGGKAYAINDHGQLAMEGAIVYDSNSGELINLNNFLSEDTEWLSLTRATNINNRGQIIGYGYLKESSRYNHIGFLANPISKPKTLLKADLNDDGIVNGKDLAELANQWLEREDWYGTLTLFQEDFENAPIDTPYPWNGYNNDEVYPDAYNRAVNISNFPEHNRDFLGNNVLYLENGGGHHLIPSQTSTVKIEYDFLFHHSDQDPNDYGSTFGNGIFLNNPPYRTDTLEIHIQKNYDSYPIQEDGIFWEENYDLQLNKIDEIIPDTWYHIERVINPEKQTEDIRMFNRDTLRELELSYTILTPTETIEGFGFGAHSNPPSYVLVDNVKIESVPN